MLKLLSLDYLYAASILLVTLFIIRMNENTNYSD